MQSTKAGVWADGAIVPFEDATIHVLSHATQRGSAVFDVIKVVTVTNPHTSVEEPFAIGLAEHVARFMGSMDLMGMTCPYSADTLADAVSATVDATPGCGVVKLVAAWSEIPLRTLPVGLDPRVWVAAMTPTPASDTSHHDELAVRLRTASGPKIPASILPPELKVAASYTAGVRERMAAVAEGFDDVLFRQVDGTLGEGTTQSAVVICGNTVLVPPLDFVLDSITRRMMLDVARYLGLEVSVRPIGWHEVTGADEIFMCSSNFLALPVSALDDIDFDTPGPVTKRLLDAGNDVLRGTHELSDRWLTRLVAEAGSRTR